MGEVKTPFPYSARKEANMNNKGKPKRDGSGQGKRKNRGRGGCIDPQDRGQKAGNQDKGIGRRNQNK